ncbi:hypothetical protein C0416_02040 [bacterium]|nr:hypothetical protein [bacterium]
MKKLDISFTGDPSLDLERIHEKLPNFLCLVSPDLKEMRHLVNGELSTQRGFSDREVEEQNIEDIFTPQAIENLRQLIENESKVDDFPETDKNRVRVVELEMKCKDESLIWTENQLSFLHDELGKLDSILLIARNVSARKIAMIRQELAIKILECLNVEEDVNETIKKIIELIRENLKIESVNFHIFEGPEEAKSFEGNEASSSIPIKGNEELLGFLQLNSNDEKTFDRETIKFFERIVDSIGITINKNRMRQSLSLKEEQLRHSQRLDSIGRLAGGIAHDFNNLLAAIIGYTEFITLGGGDISEEDKNEALDAIDSSAKRAAELTKQLLAFARKQELEFKVLDINKTFEEFKKILSMLIGKDKDIKLKFETGGNISPVKADKTQIEQVIMNLVVNARDAMIEGGIITVGVQNEIIEEDGIINHENIKAGNYVRISVSDNGTGIPENLIKNIFEPFFTTKDAGKGSGLGLSVVHGIIRQHGGHIAVESKVGEGTTFKILLPAFKQPETTSQPS